MTLKMAAFCFWLRPPTYRTRSLVVIMGKNTIIIKKTSSLLRTSELSPTFPKRSLDNGKWIDHAAEMKKTTHVYINMESIFSYGQPTGVYPCVGCLPKIIYTSLSYFFPPSPQSLIFPHTGVVRRLAVLLWLESLRSFWMQLWTWRKLAWSRSEL